MKKVLFAMGLLSLVSIVSCDKGGDGDDPEPKEESKKTFTDSRDGQKYEYVEIGTQTWMAENLNYNVDNEAPQDSCACYDATSSYCDSDGKLYTYKGTQEACPDGWHVPSDDEWKTLEKELGMSASEANSEGYRGDVEDEMLDNSVDGLSIRLSGLNDESNSGFNYGINGNYWSSTEYTSDNTLMFNRQFSNSNGDAVFRGGMDKLYGASLRCIKDN